MTNETSAAAANTPVGLSVTEQLQHATMRIEVANDKGEITSTGTGFIFLFFNHNGHSVPAVVTNKHVLEGAKKIGLRFTLQNKSGGPDYKNHFNLVIENFEKAWLPHPDPNVDLAVIPIGHHLQDMRKLNKLPFFTSIDQKIIPTPANLKSLLPLEDVLVVGYPDGIFDSANNLPIFRRGITATPAYIDFEGAKRFLIDASIFPGSSGSPVFLYNAGSYANKDGSLAIGSRLMLLGVVYAVATHATTGDIRFVPAPTQTRQVAVSAIPNNLGVCVQSGQLLAFEQVLVDKVGFKSPDEYLQRKE